MSGIVYTSEAVFWLSVMWFLRKVLRLSILPAGYDAERRELEAWGAYKVVESGRVLSAVEG